MTHTTQVLSDEQMEQLAHRTCSRYKHDTHPSYVEYVFKPHTLGDFARAIESATLKAVSGQEPFGYFRSLQFGWEDCAEFDEGAMPLFALPPAQPAPVDERAAFEAWYADHATKHNARGLTFTVEGITELREDDHYGEHRTYLNNLWKGWQARAALQGAQAPQPTKGGEA